MGFTTYTVDAGINARTKRDAVCKDDLPGEDSAGRPHLGHIRHARSRATLMTAAALMTTPLALVPEAGLEPAHYR